MTPAERLQALRAIMGSHGLTRGDVCRIMGLEPRPGGSHGTVDGWLSGRRNMSALALAHIEREAKARENKSTGE